MNPILPDLNAPYVEDELCCWYSLTHGYVVPDTCDGFDDILEEITTGDVTTPFVYLPFHEDLAESHFVDFKAERRLVVLGLSSVKGVKEEVKGNTDLGLEVMKGVDVVGKRSMMDGGNEVWEDIAIIMFPSFKKLPEFKGGVLLYSV